MDANGNATTWERDIQSRTTKEIRQNGSFKTMEYETTTSRLKKKVDAKLQETVYTYAVDDKLLSTTYVNAEHPHAEPHPQLHRSRHESAGRRLVRRESGH